MLVAVCNAIVEGTIFNYWSLLFVLVFNNKIMISGLSAILLVSTVMTFSVGLVYAQQEENATSSEPSFLGIQSAQSGWISQVNDPAYLLELNDVSDKTILFSDRPDRIVGSVNTTDFIGNWSTGPDSFAADPPDTVLVLDDEEQRQDLAVIDLYNPVYDSEANTLKYDITAENATSIGLPSEFGQSTMIIDTTNELKWCPGCNW